MKTKEEIRIRDRERLRKWRQNMSQEKKKKIAEKALLKQKAKYVNMTQAEKDEYNKRKYELSKQAFDKKDSHEKEIIRQRRLEISRKYRSKLTKEEKEKLREINNLKRREKYKNLTEEEKQVKKQKFSEWYAKNKTAYIKGMQKKNKVRRQTDMAYKMKLVCSSRLRHALKAQGLKKNAKCIDLIGCDALTLKQHLEKQFDDKMNWDNYGTYWHIDHIRPCASFDLTKLEEQGKCFHYSNLQPLEAIANIKKGALFQAPPVEADTVKP